MIVDVYGNATSLAGASAARHWDETVEAILAHARSAPDQLACTIAADPLFAQVHAVKGILLLTLARRELVAQAETCLADARAAAAQRPPLAREQLYFEALQFWLDGEPARATDVFEGLLADWPRDALAFKLCQAIRFMIGDTVGMARVGQSALSAFADRSPAAGYVRGCQAFALEELGHLAEAEAMGREAVVLAPRDAWGRHAVAHCFEMTGRARDGVAWLSHSQSWEHCSNFGFHLHWHMALFQLELGAIDAVLDLYDTAVRAVQTDDFRDLANAASLLQRLELEGVDVGHRWEELALIAEGRVADRRLVFADLHYMLALLGAGRETAAATIAENLVRDSAAAARMMHASPTRPERGPHRASSPSAAAIMLKPPACCARPRRTGYGPAAPMPSATSSSSSAWKAWCAPASSPRPRPCCTSALRRVAGIIVSPPAGSAALPPAARRARASARCWSRAAPPRRITEAVHRAVLSRGKS